MLVVVYEVVFIGMFCVGFLLKCVVELGWCFFFGVNFDWILVVVVLCFCIENFVKIFLMNVFNCSDNWCLILMLWIYCDNLFMFLSGCDCLFVFGWSMVVRFFDIYVFFSLVGCDCGRGVLMIWCCDD